MRSSLPLPVPPSFDFLFLSFDLRFFFSPDRSFSTETRSDSQARLLLFNRHRINGRRREGGNFLFCHRESQPARESEFTLGYTVSMI